MQYSEFIKTKQCASIKSGFDVDANNLNHALFDWQKAIVRWSLAQGRAALFAACGMGKSAMQLEWASQVHRHTSGDVLILAPLAVSSQTVREGKKFGIHINLCRSVNDWKPGINITNYEKLDKFNVSDLAGVVLDECFPPDTPIDVLTTNGETVKYIKDIQRNDTILNASGVDHVTSICKRQIDRAIQISVGGQRITSSENHPYFTMSGWKPAQDLQTGDHIMATKAAMRLVRNNIHPEVCRTEDAEILRKILLGEMENERSGTMRKNPHKRSAAEKGKSKSRVVQKKISSCIKRTGTYQEFKSNEQSRDSTKGIRDPASYGAQTECAGRERKTLASTTTNVTGCVGGRLVSRICSGHGEPDGGIPNTLQDRHSEPVHDDSDRSGRSIALQPEGDRLEKGYETDFVRVDGVEVLEQGHPVLEKYRDESGLVYFYDIEASRHPSFSINGLLVHNSGILKNYSGKIRNNIIDKFVNTPYKLACSATPAPNDHMELGNHAEFLNVMTRTEMLATYFIHDSSDTSKWRLKGHVKEKLFWKWMCSWAIMLEKPSDIGFSDSGYELPILKMHEHFVKSPLRSGEMFVTEATDLISRRKARNESIDLRVNKAKEIIAESGESPWLCWCNLNDESTKLKKAIDGSIEVAGAHSNEYKENALMNFAIGNTDCMVSKPKIAGHGMNFQCCSNAIFVGLSDSFEAMYQAIRRCWRFGQKNPVDIHIVLSEREGSVLNNIKQKEAKHQKMINGMVKNMSLMIQENLSQSTKSTDEDIVKHEGRNWTLYNGDCVSVVRNQPENSIDYTIFSPPFASLYTYSDSPMDMGNSKTNDDFMDHFQYLIKEMYRTTKHGRLVSIHCMDLPAMKERDGYIGLKDFSGELVRNMQDAGFVYHSRVMVWKDPLIEAVRTKSLGLMHKQICKDSSRCRQGLPDYVLTFVKPGENMDVISHPDGFTSFIGNNEPENDGTVKYSHNIWRRYASPVWMDINQGNTLNGKVAREDKDERHICPLQLDVIGRCIDLWSNPNDLVASWFTGIGSEGYQALKMDRRFIGAELKKSYADTAVKNFKGISNNSQLSLF